MKANGTWAFSACKKWSPRCTRAWAYQQRASTATLPPIGSLLGKTGKWRACVWAVVQFDYDEEMRTLHGMYGSIEAEFEVQRTIKRAELTQFSAFSRRV